MRFAARPAKYQHERVFLEALADACLTLGHGLVKGWVRHQVGEHSMALAPDFLIQWGAEPHRYLPTLHCELGWLPRWSYQVSWTGINAEHEQAGEQDDEPRDPAAVVTHLENVRRGWGMPAKGWGYCDPTVAPSTAFRRPYWLAPLQVPTDANMRVLPERLRDPQSFVDFVIENLLLGAPPVYFKQHPATSERDRVVTAPLPHKIINHRQGQVAAYLKSPMCRGVITANSNVAHDALLWGKQAVCWGSGFWGSVGDSPRVMLPGSRRTDAYLEHLMENQWTVETTTPERVARLLEAIA